MGELITLMRYLEPKEADSFFHGENEVKEMLEELGMSDSDSEKAINHSVGSLKED